MKRRTVLFLLILILAVSSSAGYAQTRTNPLLIPIGGGLSGDNIPGVEPPPGPVTRAAYARVFQGFSAEAVSRARNGIVEVLVLPIGLAPHPQAITASQKADLLRIVESRLFHVEEGCKQAQPSGVTCQATLAPLYVHTDALDPVILDYFVHDWSVVFILGGDPTIAMQVISGTPVEAALNMLFQRGVIIAGTGGGANLLSNEMLVGYQGAGIRPGLERGAAQIWNTPDQHGLLFGIQGVLVDHQFNQLGRMGGLLQAVSLPAGPNIGVGLDAYTGVHIPSGQTLENVFGPYNVTILDAETYGSARESSYRDCGETAGCKPVLSIRNVIVHLLAPGPFSYDLKSRQHSLAEPAPVPERNYASLAIPEGAGPLILSGDLSESLEGSPILSHFGELSGGEDGWVVVVTAGFPSDSSAQRMADRIAAELKGRPIKYILPKNATQFPSLPKYFTGIVFALRDQSKLKPELLAPIRDAWLSGIPLLADNGGAAAMGAFFSSHGPTPPEGTGIETATQRSFLDGETRVRAGLGLLDLTIEPQIINDNRWGRLFSLAYHHPSLLAIGLTQDTALEIDYQGARVLGDNVVFVVDLSSARLDLGANRSFVIANGLMDVFAPGEAMFVQRRLAGGISAEGDTTEASSLPSLASSSIGDPLVSNSDSVVNSLFRRFGSLPILFQAGILALLATLFIILGLRLARHWTR